ncbi:hypothetical protein E2C01_064777 [Portunus trituberculatus]|uniref:Uncharacterized protein n=1 Tax=Portunus trituberculatus TaxID=210409 RepID=A0A5B7HKQ9_PORTR|nr:hypothetical protein [Portunus trituberculatus]
MPRLDPSACPRHSLRLSEAPVATYKVASSLYHPASATSPAPPFKTLSESSSLILARVNVDCESTNPISRVLRSGGAGGSDGAGTRPEIGDHSGHTSRGRQLGWWRARLLVSTSAPAGLPREILCHYSNASIQRCEAQQPDWQYRSCDFFDL